MKDFELELPHYAFVAVCPSKGQPKKSKLLLLLVKLRQMHNEEAPTRNPLSVMGFIGLAIALPPPSVHEVRLESYNNFDLLRFTVSNFEVKSELSDKHITFESNLMQARRGQSYGQANKAHHR